MRVEGIMGTEGSYNLLAETLKDNWTNKASVLRTYNNSIISDMRSLATLDLATARCGDFYLSIFLKNSREIVNEYLERICK